MEAYIKDQIVPALKYVPFHLAASYFKKPSSEVEEKRKQAGGFIKGICHPTDNYEQIKGAGLEWNRADIPFPFDETGNVSPDYLRWKERMRAYRENGIRIMAVTPNPVQYIKAGIDPRLPENEARVKEIAVFMLEDLRELIGAVQIANEMGMPRFTLPVTMKEAVRFIGINLEAMHAVKGDILVGYNCAGPQADLNSGLRPWLKYCDYVGLDLYIGCFFSLGCWLVIFDFVLRYLWSLTGKPIIMCEFGYISGGAPKTPEEKRAVLERYGVSSEAQARKNMDEMMRSIQRVNPDMYNFIKRTASGDYGDFIFKLDFCNHFYSELPAKTVIKKYPHTPQGQADFYRDFIPRLAKFPFLIGAFIYCYRDSERCYVCKQEDCPTETRWGLVTIDGKEKPSYYAVRDALNNI